MEKKKDGALSFLDFVVRRRDDGELITSVFLKTTNTVQRLSYKSNHPQAHKRSCVKTLFKRVEIHCTTPEAKEEEFRFLKRQFSLNGCPSSFRRLCGNGQQAVQLQDLAYRKQFHVLPKCQEQSPVSTNHMESELPIVLQEPCASD